MAEKLELAIGFTSLYGIMLLGNLDMEKDADYFNVTPETVGRYLDAGVANVREQGAEARELHLVRPMLELLISLDRNDIKALGIGITGWAELTLEGAVLGGMPDEEWKLVFEYARHKLFGLPPMTDAEKQAVKQEVTIIDESLDDFRARMRAEGRIPGPRP
jgi:hypothetical protein